MGIGLVSFKGLEKGGCLALKRHDITLRCKLVRPEIAGCDFKPRYATSGSAGMDLYAALERPVVLHPGETVRIPTGMAIQLPDSGYAALVFPRSGIAANHGITLVNAVGVVDSDYTGEVLCPIINLSNQAYAIRPGDRIAQLVVIPVARVAVDLVSELERTERGDGGFGSTGR